MDYNNLDIGVINLARAIRQKESSGGRNQTSKLAKEEGSFGGMQYTAPTFNEQAKLLGGKDLNGNPLDINNNDHQNLVFYTWAKKLKDAGYGVDQIAAAHNAGEGKLTSWQNHRGVNRFGNKYDTPAYVNEVLGYYRALKGEAQPQEPVISQTPKETYEVPPQPRVKVDTSVEDAKAIQQAKEDTSAKGMLKNFGKAFVRNIAGSEVGLGETISKIATSGKQSAQVAKDIEAITNQQIELRRRIKEKEAKGQDATRLKVAYNDTVKQIGEQQGRLEEARNLPSKQKVYGQLGGTALDVLTAGTYGAAAKGLKSGKLVTKTPLVKAGATAVVPELGQIATQQSSGLLTKKGAGNVLKGASIGYGYDVTQGLQGARGEERTGGKAFIPGLGTAIGGGIPAVAETTKSIQNLPSQAPKIMQRVSRTTPLKQAKFEKLAGKTQGEYLVERGIYGNEENVMKQLADRFESSKQTADAALSGLDGTFKPEPVKTALQELLQRETRVSSPGAISPDLTRVQQLSSKLEKSGLTMSEINEAKRLFERNIRLDFVKQNLPEGVARSTNIDNAIRSWQFGQAEKLGLKNLKEINKETQLARQLLDDMGRTAIGKSGNNAISLSDWIVLSGGDPTAVSAFVTKKVFGSKGVQSKIAKTIAKKPTVGQPSAILGGKQGLPALIPGVDYRTAIEVAPSKKLLPFSQEKAVERVSTRSKQQSLPVLEKKSKISLSPTVLPKKEKVNKLSTGDISTQLPKLASYSKKFNNELELVHALQYNKPEDVLNEINLYRKSGNPDITLDKFFNSGKKIMDSLRNEGGYISTGSNDLIKEAKKYKTAEEFVEAQGTSVYRGEGGSNVAQGKALLAEGKHFASDAEYPKGFGAVSENIIKPNTKVLDLGDSTFAEISKKLGIPERRYISPKELSFIAKEKGYDVLKYNGEYKSTGKQFTHFVDLTGDSIIPKSQLEQIWEEAQRTGGSNDLIKEAKKYKTAEEFVKAQGSPVYHGGDINKIEDRPIFTSTDKRISETYGDVSQFYQIKNLKEINIFNDKKGQDEVRKILTNKYEEQIKIYKELSDYEIKNIKDKRYTIHEDLFDKKISIDDYKKWEVVDNAITAVENIKKSHIPQQFIYDNWSILLKELKNKGYDKVIHETESLGKEFSGNETIFLNPIKSLKTKSQLEQIWEEAQRTGGSTKINPLTTIAGATAVGAGAINVYNNSKKKTLPKKK